MKTLMAGAVVLGAVLTTAQADAQAFPAYRFPDPLTLVGPGSAIGVRVREVTADEARKLSADVTGVYIDEVVRGAPAERAGLKGGDIVVEFDGERVRGVRSFTRLVSETPPGRTVKATVVRDGARRTLDVTPEQSDGRSLLGTLPRLPRGLPPARPTPAPPPRNLIPDAPPLDVAPVPRRLGVTLSPLNDQLADYFGVTRGVLVSAVDVNSPASRAGMKAGDVITDINGRAVRRPTDVSEAVRDASAGSTLALTVMRDKTEVTLRVAVGEVGRF